MMSSRFEIQWTPFANKFITWGNEISLYEVLQSKTDDGDIGLKFCNVGSSSTYHYVKCFDICCCTQGDILFAVGQSNGRIGLGTFGPSQFDSYGFVGRDLVPRYSRPCNAVAWNPVDSFKIVAGLDKYRSDHAVLLWDVMKHALAENGTAHPSRSSSSDGIKPISEFGLSDSTNSLTWFSDNHNVLAAGMNMKTIRLIDFRDTNKPANATQTKAVYGVCIDPDSNDRYLASFYEYQLCIWDTRNFEKPISTLTHLKPVSKISWSPTCNNEICCLERDSSYLNLYDVKHTIIGSEELDTTILERPITFGTTHSISSFSWHRFDKNRLISITTTGQIIDYSVSDRMTLNWAPNSNIVWSNGNKIMKCKDTNLPLKSGEVGATYDISTKIRYRASKGYGLQDQLDLNADFVDDVSLQTVWCWLHRSGTLTKKDSPLSGSATKHPGIVPLFRGEFSSSKSEAFNDNGINNCLSNTRVFRSDERDKALMLSGWQPFGTTFNVNTSNSQSERDCSRLAALALWQQQITDTIEILNRGADISPAGNNSVILSAVALAIVASSSEDKQLVRRQLVAFPRAKLIDPYLRAIVAFLTAENCNYDAILNEPEISLTDRVAFALIYLPDNKLQDFLRSSLVRVLEDGNLEGIILTGNDSNDGIKLLQRYLDVSHDIQSTALISARGFNVETTESNFWCESYRYLLDMWQMWSERALFDIMIGQCRSAEKYPQQIYMSCNFCGKSIAMQAQGINRRQNYSRMNAIPNKLKMSACPTCRKPLPRCAICMMHMGTTVGTAGDLEAEIFKTIHFDNWFTWCQSCRHGGHATHMSNWFKEHTECPVTSCACRCFSIDSV